jgi:hypothetical protein
MNTPSKTNTPRDSYPKGVVVSWTGGGECAGSNLTFVHRPTVLIDSIEGAVSFESSLDGAIWRDVRDLDGLQVRLTKPGVYELPVSVGWLKPVMHGEATISVFIPG